MPQLLDAKIFKCTLSSGVRSLNYSINQKNSVRNKHRIELKRVANGLALIHLHHCHFIPSSENLLDA